MTTELIGQLREQLIEAIAVKEGEDPVTVKIARHNAIMLVRLLEHCVDYQERVENILELVAITRPSTVDGRNRE